MLRKKLRVNSQSRLTFRSAHQDSIVFDVARWSGDVYFTDLLLFNLGGSLIDDGVDF